MKSLFRATPCGDTIFCDDIRHETTGKSILIGVYASHMFVTTPFPVKVKLAMRVSYQEHRGESDEPLQLQVYAPGNKDGEPFFKFDIPADARKAVPAPPVNEPKNDDTAEVFDSVINSTFHLDLHELAVAKPGPIRVRMKRGDIMVRLGSLVIMPLPSAENNASERAES